MNHQKIDFDRELIERCQINAPRYTSYPTADRFSLDFGISEQLSQINKVFTPEFDQAVSLYIHIPFCNTLCLYCGCNKIITNNRNKITEYLEYLAKEFALYHQLIGKKLPVVQLHFGGGSPSWLSIDEVHQVMELVRQYFDLSNAAEIAMELDPRHVTDEFMEALHNEGFNRVSLGVQDFDPDVQKAVNRIQPLTDTKRVLDKAADLGFSSTSIDLIYGLPLQNLQSYAKTIDIVINQLKPARIALFNYAHLPHIFMPQTRINEADLPSATEKLNILQMCVERLADAGYVFIGMDHFARPEDELAIALNNGTLQRNFQGYSTFADTHMLAFGVSSIGFVGNSYYQSAKDLDSYYNFINNSQLPILRGMMLNQDDIIRRDIIQQIMCQFKLDFNQVANKYQLDFAEYFAAELADLPALVELGLITLNATNLEVSSKGRFLIRNIAVVFDKYLRQRQDNKRYSKVI
ncbi:MAG TPA: oxygen-independent coproporphyrinogen III oxidase [Burkholderiales bacterium]|nr:oxygen-independent coproporphyrinogen III oxidase [Burkholderiales bacterium]